MPNVMAALPNIGGALCSTPLSLDDAHYWTAMHNAANTRNRLQFPGVPQTRQQIPGISRPKFTILSGHVEEVLLFNSFFSIVDTCLSSKEIARQSCAMVPKWWFFCVLYFQRVACSRFQTRILNFSKIKYLGVYFICNTGLTDITDSVRKFYLFIYLFIMYIVHKVQNIRNTHIKHTTGIKRYK